MKDRFFANKGSFSNKELEKIYNTRVAVIGCGGLGGYIIQELVQFGIRELVIVDADKFELTNLNRQLYCNENNLGLLKVAQAKKNAEKVNSAVMITAYDKKFDAENGLEILKDCDIVIDGVDSIQTRFVIVALASQINIPYVCCSVAGFYGQITSIFPKDNTLAKLYDKNTDTGIEKKTGNFSFSVAAIASIGVSQVIKIIINRGNVLQHHVLLVDILSNEFKIISLQK
ncbi:MAG: HesA/MoeB/ThiF family protein [Candidatus Cloacimonadota bacterium]|nr:HesA/MoeB/ThiF family protein [Candidatus Cloacimonadota bacterium]